LGDQLGDIRSSVVAISVAGQQHGLVMIDEDGDPLAPAKLWNDTTAAPKADSLVEQLGAATWAERCGSVPVAAFTIAKLGAALDNDPGLADRAAKVMLPHDYLTWRLTGQHVTDRGDASGTGWFDPAADRYRDDLLATVGPPAQWRDRLPRVLGPSEAAGSVTGDACAELGLGSGGVDVVVGPGTGDNMGAALGLGLQPGDVVISLGTSGTVFASSPAPTADPSGAVAGFASADGGFLPLVCTLNATKVTDTVAQWLGTDAAGLADLALAAGDDAGGVELVPYFDGERTPNLPDATGTLTGLRTSTTREQLALAAHDGVLQGLLAGVEALRSAGVVTDGQLSLVGGGARSKAYRHRLTTLWGRAIRLPDADEAVATGAAVQAAATFTGEPLAEVSARWGLSAER
jgi:xylulokinase